MTTQQDPNTNGERVVFTSTGATGTVLGRYINDSPFAGDLAGEWATVQFDDGDVINVRADSLTVAEAAEADAEDTDDLTLKCERCGRPVGILPTGRARAYRFENGHAVCVDKSCRRLVLVRRPSERAR
jgi:hypothetical protein